MILIIRLQPEDRNVIILEHFLHVRHFKVIFNLAFQDVENDPINLTASDLAVKRCPKRIIAGVSGRCVVRK